MLRIAVVCRNAKERAALRAAMEQVVDDLRISSVEVSQHASFDELEATVSRLRPEHFDFALCRIGGADDVPTDAAGEPLASRIGMLREGSPRIELMLASTDVTHAFWAYELGCAFVLLPSNLEQLAGMAAGIVRRLDDRKRLRMAVRSSGGVENVAVGDIQFVEASKRGPIIHLPEGRTVLARGTLQTIYDKLEGLDATADAPLRHQPFVKAGSSFVVNLDNVRASGEGALIFADGEAIIVPVRKRKDVKDALDAFQLR